METLAHKDLKVLLEAHKGQEARKGPLVLLEQLALRDQVDLLGHKGHKAHLDLTVIPIPQLVLHLWALVQDLKH